MARMALAEGQLGRQANLQRSFEAEGRSGPKGLEGGVGGGIPPPTPEGGSYLTTTLVRTLVVLQCGAKPHHTTTTNFPSRRMREQENGSSCTYKRSILLSLVLQWSLTLVTSTGSASKGGSLKGVPPFHTTVVTQTGQEMCVSSLRETHFLVQNGSLLQ